MRTRAAALAMLLAGCISVKDQERHRVGPAAVPAENREDQLQRTSVGGVELRSFVYKPRLLPLEDFFKRIARGDLKEAIRRADLRYSPSNADDKALKTLLKHGIAPAYIDVANTGGAPVDLSRLRLALADSGSRFEPIPNDQLPKVFEEFNPKAAAANVYNTGAAIVGCAAALAVLAAGVVAGGDPFGGFGVLGVLGELPGFLDDEVYNELKKTTHVEYDGLLWKPGVLAPGERARGLVFFRAGSADWTSARLAADLTP
ncbi:MAG: hypothetical protein HY553_13060 [Elusimicrobia bacterium]|nr:hypothetical protein [Elusimicrobiota bacterium]